MMSTEMVWILLVWLMPNQMYSSERTASYGQSVKLQYQRVPFCRQNSACFPLHRACSLDATTELLSALTSCGNIVFFWGSRGSHQLQARYRGLWVFLCWAQTSPGVMLKLS